MSNFWRAIFEPKTDLSIDDTYGLARRAGYPFFSHGGKIYAALVGDYREAPTRPEILDEPQVFAVMDKNETGILMLHEGIPFLFLSIQMALALAQKHQGVVKPLGEALWLNREAAKKESTLIVPPSSGEIIAARG